MNHAYDNNSEKSYTTKQVNIKSVANHYLHTFNSMTAKANLITKQVLTA